MRVRIITRLRSEADAHAALERGAEISPETSHHGVYSPAVAIEDDNMQERLKEAVDALRQIASMSFDKRQGSDAWRLDWCGKRAVEAIRKIGREDER